MVDFLLVIKLCIWM